MTPPVTNYHYSVRIAVVGVAQLVPILVGLPHLGSCSRPRRRQDAVLPAADVDDDGVRGRGRSRPGARAGDQLRRHRGRRHLQARHLQDAVGVLEPCHCHCWGFFFSSETGKLVGESLSKQFFSTLGGVIPAIAMGQHARAIPRSVKQEEAGIIH